MIITLKIFRFNPEIDKQPYYDLFTVEANTNDRILDCLNKIRSEQDSSLSYRMSCGHGVCGSDALLINGKPVLACQKLVKDYDYTQILLVEPLKYFPIIKDLNVNMKAFFSRLKAIHPLTAGELHNSMESERIQSIEERAVIDDAIKCILCGCCVAACPVMLKEEPKFIGPAAILRAQKHIFDSRSTDTADRMQVIDNPLGVWSCKTYGVCTVVCPKNIKVAEAILSTKKKINQELHSTNMQEIG